MSTTWSPTGSSPSTGTCSGPRATLSRSSDPWKFKLDHSTQARVAFAVPYAGYPFLWLADRDSRMLAIGLPAGLIALLSLWQIVTILRGKDEQSPGRSGHPSVPVRG